MGGKEIIPNLWKFAEQHGNFIYAEDNEKLVE